MENELETAHHIVQLYHYEEILKDNGKSNRKNGNEMETAITELGLCYTVQYCEWRLKSKPGIVDCIWECIGPIGVPRKNGKSNGKDNMETWYM